MHLTARFRRRQASVGSAGVARRVERPSVGFPRLAQLTSLRLARSVPVFAGQVVLLLAPFEGEEGRVLHGQDAASTGVTDEFSSPPRS